jgi:hypothetical protein
MVGITPVALHFDCAPDDEGTAHVTDLETGALIATVDLRHPAGPLLVGMMLSLSSQMAEAMGGEVLEVPDRDAKLN